MNKFERLLEAKNEAEKLGAILIYQFPEKRDELYRIVLKYVNQFERYNDCVQDKSNIFSV